jgi:hypothetical protein
MSPEEGKVCIGVASNLKERWSAKRACDSVRVGQMLAEANGQASV